MPAKIYRQNKGTDVMILIKTDQDLTTASNQVLKIKRPDGTETDKECEIIKVDDKFYFHTVMDSTDIPDAGDYIIQPYFEIDDWAGRCTPVVLKVSEWWE